MSNVARLPNAWLSKCIDRFLEESEDALLGEILRHSSLSVELEQRNAWLGQIGILKAALVGLQGQVFFELTIPRIGKRIDTVILTNGRILILEFKVGSAIPDAASLNQVWDYALDLKNFHAGSHDAEIVPILIPTNLNVPFSNVTELSDDGVWDPFVVAVASIGTAIDELSKIKPKRHFIQEGWADSAYKPTPTIVEAARNLYAKHSVHDILRNDAGAKNITVTSKRVEEVIRESRENRRKSICFVTGVPGAGKTLVGLNVATRHSKSDDLHSVFLSGNGPLVEVLVEALTRDELAREKGRGNRPKKIDVKRSVRAFIQNVHHFRDEGVRQPDKAPNDHVVIFDESQRAWNHRKTSDFMQRKKGIAGFDASEPEFLISCMDRHNDWAVIVCLVGGGQEIHDGEAGIKGWFEAIQNRFQHWSVYVSDQMGGSEYHAGDDVRRLKECGILSVENQLHLSSSMRSFRAENVSVFVKAVLDCEPDKARDEISNFATQYPIVVTRDLVLAKKWLRQKARGTERTGLVASSKAQRLKPHAIDVRINVDPVHYFLNECDDVRSSFYLEDAATEFQVQGLELDWVLVSWDGDLRHNKGRWSHNQFRGNKWMRINKAENQLYLLNAYRVLLTRARQGMAIFVPHGDEGDHTRLSQYYDDTFEYLARCGVPVI